MNKGAEPAASGQDIMTGGVAARVLDVIVREGGIDRTKLVPDATLDQLEVASIGVVMILNGLEQEFDIVFPMDDSIADVRTVRDLVAMVGNLAASQGAAPQ
jgi:acyl carrier protein